MNTITVWTLTYVIFNRIYGGNMSVELWIDLSQSQAEEKYSKITVDGIELCLVTPHYTCTFWKYFWLRNFELGLSHNLILPNSCSFSSDNFSLDK